MAKEKPKIKYSVQMTLILIFSAFLAVTIGMMNVYPTTSARDIVAAAKQDSMLGQTAVMTASLSALEKLSPEGVEQVMELIGSREYTRVVVTDRDGLVLYDSRPYGGLVGRQQDFDELNRALLETKAVFYSHYTGGAFESCVAAPIISYGATIGGVYISEVDTGQAALIDSIQSRMRTISVIAGVVALAVVIVFSRALTRRLRDLVKGMRIVREGDYDYRIPTRGRDEVRELSEEFNDMTGRLQSTEELRRRFVSDASHELRTPLASIRLLSDSVVQSENMDENTMREFVTDIGSEAERLQRLTEKLLHLTRMDSDVPVERGPVDLRQVAERTVHLLDPLAKARFVTIRTDFAGDCVIRSTEDDIYQIIFNLAENAVKYNRRDGEVFLRLRREGTEAVLTVEDTGIGIPAADAPYIFDRFYRVDKARSRAHGGSGLGLSIVRDTVIANGGEIGMEAREPAGTRFTVRFPLWETAEQEAGA